jgi:hypothetical protein
MAGCPRRRNDFAYLNQLRPESVAKLFSDIERGQSLTSIAAALTVNLPRCATGSKTNRKTPGNINGHARGKPRRVDGGSPHHFGLYGQDPTAIIQAKR